MEPEQKPKPAAKIALPKPDFKGFFRFLDKLFKKMGSINPAYWTPLSIMAAGAMISLSIMAAGGAFLVKNKALTGSPFLPSAPLPANPQPANPSIPSAPALSADKVDKVSSEDHIKGNKNARYQLIEYSDLECPFCKKFHPDAQKILQNYSGNLSWVYRHFPLDQIHSKARKEAEAAECAAEQGGNDAFWKFVDKVFEVTPGNNGLDAAELPKIATLVGLDGTKLQSCVDSGKMAQKVEAQYQSGIKIGIAGTPSSVLLDTNTGKAEMIPGAIPYDQLKAKIDAMINGSQK